MLLNEIFAEDLIMMSKNHMLYLSFVIFRDAIEAHQFKNPNSKANLLLLAKIFALKQLQIDCT